MTPNEYQKLAARSLMSNATQAEKLITAIENSPRLAQIIIAGQKLNSESGELNDAIVKHTSYGQPLDVDNIKEECGDLLWYIADILTALDSTMEEVMQANIDKLAIRYPEKFTEEHASLRLDKQEGFKERTLFIKDEEAFPFCGKCQHQPCTCGFMKDEP